RDRSDWCISRQRTWGVPIPVVYCKDCGKPICNDETISAISELFRKEGSDAWWIKDTKDFIPASVKCECGCSEFTKEYDIMDVWFDSGVSHTSVMEGKDFPSLSWPADLYLEGADQYRGWFQSSLLTSVVYKGQSPYKAVCTHGWVVDGEGKAMHKSLGNGIDPSEITDQYGADILRLWAASSDYHSDIRISKPILGQLSDAYKKIRNTARFILGNLGNGAGFDPDKDSVSDDQLTELDKWALMKLDNLIDTMKKGYDAFDFHIALHALHNFCVIDMSNFYLDIIKDRLYCEKEDSVLRRAAQTAMYRIISAMTRLAAPIISFTAEEIWQFMPHSAGDDKLSVFLNQMPEKSSIDFTAEFKDKWEFIYNTRLGANKALEDARNEKTIGKSLEAKIIIKSSDADYDRYVSLSDQLKDILIVSGVEVEKAGTAETEFTVAKAEGDKCERCWCFSKYVGTNHTHPTLCERCAVAVEA
ncbi:class I tRNA ligase family protein, partial [Ruminococcus flavefaciens]|uniref:class I tRNA ligase family protein n=1 Tax=Ruminococcus flavefaciens TaxID=1265 RepID=UPI0026EC3C4A